LGPSTNSATSLGCLSRVSLCVHGVLGTSHDEVRDTLDTNATEAHIVSTWLNDTKVDQLHHVVVGVLAMFTSNVNIAKCVVNGATATVTSVHMVSSQPLVFNS
jgi:hypothetical protein